MARIQQSIDIGVPVHTLYNQLTLFEEYPRFMQDVETVQQLDDIHLHWKARMSDQPMEWDATITEQVPDRCIAWHNAGGPMNGGKVEVQPVSAESSRVTLTLESGPEQMQAPSAGNGENDETEMSHRLREDLARLKNFVESRGSETGAWRGEVHDAEVTTRDRDAKARNGGAAGETAGQETGPVATLGIAQGTGQTGNPAGHEGVDEVALLGSVEGSGQATGEKAAQSAARHQNAAGQQDQGNGANPVATSSYAAGSEGFDGTEDPPAPVASSSRPAAQQRSDSAGPVWQQQTPSSGAASSRPQTNDPTQSDYSLSQSVEDGATDGRFSVAEEVNLDQQSDAVRHVGQLEQEPDTDSNEGPPTLADIGKALQQERQDFKKGHS